jgi:hypothetical protein
MFVIDTQCKAMPWHGMAWHGMAWHGMAWHAMPWHGMAWHGVARQLEPPLCSLYDATGTLIAVF